jgi:hypothetical protein
MSHYPDEGELFKASKKKSEHLIFFAHFFKGHKKVLRRHIELVNELGYDAYVFNLRDELDDHYFLPYSYVSEKFGMKHALADQIEDHLNLLPEYKTKIVYAFSNIGGCAIEAMARRQQQDVIALICDSGPGASFIYSSYKLVQEQYKVKFLPLKVLATPLVMFGWSKDLQKDIPEDLKKLPEGFPVLSIRGWKDKLISPGHIDKIFEPCKNIHWVKLALPDAGHLDGLKLCPSEYKAGVVNFLSTL